jgi:glyoxylase-like metal-dependent hydrolase (beta-lactamase superfamily II)
MEFKKRDDNIYMIDTFMMDFEHYQSCYIVKGKEVVMVDTGMPPALEKVRAGMKSHGFTIQDVSKIFVSHCEHPDHAGNVGAFVKENPRIKVFINPAGLEYLTNPEIEAANRKKVMVPQMAARFGTQLPVPTKNLEMLKDGDVLDIGDGEELKIMFTPAHQPSGYVILEKRNKGLFINDLVGNYFPDCNFNLILTPYRSDVIRAKEDLKKFMAMNFKKLYLGHFGIADNPEEVYKSALAGIQRQLDIGSWCVKEGRPRDIEMMILGSKYPEIEKLKKRSDILFEYTKTELATHHSTYFAEYYLSRVKNELKGNT